MASGDDSDQSEHVVAHAAFHRTRLTVFIFDSGCSSISGHFFKAFAELCVGLGDCLGILRGLGFLFRIGPGVALRVVDFLFSIGRAVIYRHCQSI